MNNRYRLEIGSTFLQVRDTKLFTSLEPNGVIVCFVGCGNNRDKLKANLKRLRVEYDVAPQNVISK